MFSRLIYVALWNSILLHLTVSCIHHITVVYTTVMVTLAVISSSLPKKCFSEHFLTYLLIRPIWEFLWFISNNGIARSHGSGIFIFTKECFSTSYCSRGRPTNYLICRILWINIVYNLNKRVLKMLIGVLEERIPRKSVSAKHSLN